MIQCMDLLSNIGMGYILRKNAYSKRNKPNNNGCFIWLNTNLIMSMTVLPFWRKSAKETSLLYIQESPKHR